MAEERQGSLLIWVLIVVILALAASGFLVFSNSPRSKETSMVPLAPGSELQLREPATA